MSTDASKKAENDKSSQVSKNNGQIPPGQGSDKLHIFINKIKFDEQKGIKPQMTGGELADLVSVPRDNAKITRLRDDQEFTVTDTIVLHMADHFEILRNKVTAGYGK